MRSPWTEQVSEHSSGGGRWQRIRAQVIRRDHGLCVVCGEPGEEVDHIVPKHPPHYGTDDMANLRLLCRECHAPKSKAETAAKLRQIAAQRFRKQPPHPGLIA
ncbi:HNH endonuclease [Kribbella sp. WER1]